MRQKVVLFGSELRSAFEYLRIELKQNGPRCGDVITPQTKGYKPIARTKGRSQGLDKT